MAATEKQARTEDILLLQAVLEHFQHSGIIIVDVAMAGFATCDLRGEHAVTGRSTSSIYIPKPSEMSRNTF